MKWFDYKGTKVRFIVLKYQANGTLALEMVNEKGDRMCIVTNNLDSITGWHFQSRYQAFVDSNNYHDLPDWLEDNGIAECMYINCKCGYCTYPLYKFNLDKI